jgi:hypothetical protein
MTIVLPRKRRTRRCGSAATMKSRLRARPHSTDRRQRAPGVEPQSTDLYKSGTSLSTPGGALSTPGQALVVHETEAGIKARFLASARTPKRPSTVRPAALAIFLPRRSSIGRRSAYCSKATAIASASPASRLCDEAVELAPRPHVLHFRPARARRLEAVAAQWRCWDDLQATAGGIKTAP